MRDNEINILLRGALLRMAPVRGLPGVEFKQAFQSTQQGRPNDTTVTWYNIGHRRYGSPAIGEQWSNNAGKMVRTETQVMESTYQFSVTMNIDPANILALTHGDVLKSVAAMLQSPSFIVPSLVNGLQVLRIMDIRNVPVENDRGQFEPNMSFDVTFTHNDKFVDDVPVVATFDFSIYPV